MKLISCDSCGVVLDQDKLPFPLDIYGDDEVIDETKAMWYGRVFVAFCKCPVCEHKIPKED